MRSLGIRSVLVGVVAACLGSTSLAAGTLAPAAQAAVEAAAPAATDGSAPAPVTQLLVTYSPDAGRGGEAAVLRAAGTAGVSLRPGAAVVPGLATVRLDRPVDMATAADLAEQLERDPRVESASPDVPLRAVALPNDTRLLEQWPLIGEYGINYAAAWPAATGKGVVVAVLDTGITAHPDLTGRVAPGYDMISNPASARDGDGRDADPSDMGEAPDSLFPASWHGTHVAGTIAASAHNGLGVAGVAPGARVQPVRMLGAGGSGVTSDLIAAITWAAGLPVPGVPLNPTPARVINMSLGSDQPVGCPVEMQSAITAAVTAGVTVVVAAGNSGDHAALYAPANCDGVVTVAATGPTGYPAGYSNWGDAVDLAAPGGDFDHGFPGGVLSTYNSGRTTFDKASYAFMEGTSMAAPHVAGAAAVLLGAEASLTPAQVEQRLKATARQTLRCTTKVCGAGLLDLGRLLDPGRAVAEPDVSRLQGLDRFDTASQATLRAFPDGADTVYVATGENFPDALGGGPAAAEEDAPILLVSLNAIPPDTRGALTALKPRRIVVLGSSGVISTTVANQLRTLAPTVTRLPGANRFDTAARAALRAFPAGADTVYVATGENFPDALGGGPAAAREGGPVLLVGATGIPAETRDAITTLAPDDIVILGGPTVVSDAIEQQLRAPGRTVTRLNGADRYATAALAVRRAFPDGADTVYVATGENFPDALGGGPAAARDGAPVLLVGTDHLPDATRDAITALRPDRVVVLGGPTVVSPGVEGALHALVP